ncbi:hypothetical protein [Fusobacterium sp. SYSU M8D902]|uniref:hypothetical protein n=1 Tax=Fusobacterium sp. SYSU M8D902 TaxID=3159562 RepID=UPI0032E3F3D8
MENWIELSSYFKLNKQEIEPQENEKFYLAKFDDKEVVIHIKNMVITKIINFAEEIAWATKKEGNRRNHGKEI